MWSKDKRPTKTHSLFYTYLFKFECDIATLLDKNHAFICSWNQPVLSNESLILAQGKYRRDLNSRMFLNIKHYIALHEK